MKRLKKEILELMDKLEKGIPGGNRIEALVLTHLKRFLAAIDSDCSISSISVDFISGGEYQ